MEQSTRILCIRNGNGIFRLKYFAVRKILSKYYGQHTFERVLSNDILLIAN